MARAKKDGDLYLASNVDVVRGKEKNAAGQEVPKVVRVAAGQMVSDTDLTADEIKSLKLQGVVRVPTQAESDALDAQADAKGAAESAAEADVDAKLLAQTQENERARLAAEQATTASEEAAKLAEKQEKDRLAAAKSGGKK